MSLVQFVPPVVVARMAANSLLEETSDVPTATQSAVEAHETPRRLSTPPGTGSLVQLAPPLSVTTMVPELELPDTDVPTATHSEADGHETPSSALAPLGKDSLIQLAPPFAVATATPAVPAASAPTAMQSDIEEQEIALRPPIPPGSGSLAQLVPPFVVPTTAPAVPAEFIPTAKHVEVEGHETPLTKVPGIVMAFQFVPPFVVTRAAPEALGPKGPISPVTTQSDALEHDTAFRLPIPAGTGSLAHVSPPLTVTRIPLGRIPPHPPVGQ